MWELLLKSRKFKVASAIAGIIILLGIVGPFFTRDPEDLFVGMPFQPPSLEFLLGTTVFGEDVFAQLCMGIRNSLLVGVLAGSIGTFLAIVFGAVGSYKGGIADEASSMVTNIVIVLPVWPLLIVLASFIEHRSLFIVALLIALTNWPWAARSIRSQVLSLKEREFINLARMSGMKDWRIYLTEVLPNMLAYIIMVFVLLVGTSILSEAGISLLGAGPTRTVTLGKMLFWAQSLPSSGAAWWDSWWWFIPPGLVLTIFITSIIIMHSGMDEVFNPRLRQV